LVGKRAEVMERYQRVLQGKGKEQGYA